MRLAALLLSCFVCSAAAIAAEALTELGDPSFQHLTRDQGLPQGVVLSLAEDGDGFIWAGTQGGLARWDGYRIRAYKPAPGKADALPDGIINILHTDRQGRLWIGTQSGDLVRFDAELDRFVTYPSTGNALIAIADDGDNGLWLANDAGLFHFDGTASRPASVSPPASDGVSPLGRIQDLLLDRQGRLWIGGYGGLAYLDKGASAVRTVPLLSASGKPVIVTCLYQDSSGRLWIGTNHTGVYLLEPGADKPLPLQDANGGSLNVETVLMVTQAGPNEVWLATYNGIAVIDLTSWQSRRLRHDPSLPGSLAHNAVFAVMQDRSGMIWAGGAGGLDQLIGRSDGVRTVFGADHRIGGIDATDVTSLMTASDGRLWLGFGEDGAAVYDPSGRPIGRLLANDQQPETSLPRTQVQGMAEFGDDVYIGTLRGLYRSDRSSKAVRRVNLPNRDPAQPVTAVSVDGNLLWLGDGSIGGLRVFALAGPLPPQLADLDGGKLTSKFVTALARGDGGDLWIGTRNGLNRLDLSTGQIEQIAADPGDSGGLVSGFVSSLLLDRTGRLWVGTEGAGVAIMTGRNAEGRPRFRGIGAAEGLPNQNVDMLLQDRSGKIWASTDDGIAAIDPDNLTIRALHRAEGVAIPSYWLNAGAVIGNGDLLFGGRGLTILRPDRISEWSYRPPVVVTDLRVGGKPVSPGGYNGGRTAQTLEIAPDANSLAVEFSALDYSAPERNRYAYRLDGYDRDWIETEPARRIAAYTNLPPGSYVLRLRGSNRDGLWSDRTLALPISVLPAWNQTIWFTLTLMVLAAGSILLIVQTRTNYLRRARKELEERVEERTRELREAKDELERLATQDGLTQVANRRRFDAVLKVEVLRARRENRPLSVLMIDVDDFKAYNDLYGHLGGDEVLRRVSALCQAEIMRPTDLLARYGGEEFAVILPDTDESAALAIAERIVLAIRDAAIAHARARAADRVTVSIGVASTTLAGIDGEKLVALSDAALYQAKRSGRNQAVAATVADQTDASLNV